MCTVGVRLAGHGYSVKDNYEICVTHKQVQIAESSFFVKGKGDGKTFWCVTTTNTNFVCRRGGKVHVTGNCHGSPTDIEGRIMDVGWDAHGKILNLEDVVSDLKQVDIVGRR